MDAAVAAARARLRPRPLADAPRLPSGSPRSGGWSRTSKPACPSWPRPGPRRWAGWRASPGRCTAVRSLALAQIAELCRSVRNSSSTAPAPARRSRLVVARAGRRGRGDRAVERAVRDHGQQGCLRAADRLHRGDEAVARNPARGLYHRRSRRSGGLPPGVVNLVPSHREAADHLVNNPGIDKVSFTGSTLAGKRIAQVCGGRIARYTLELGGKSAAIIARRLPDRRRGQAAHRHAQHAVAGRSARCSAARSSPRRATTSWPRRSRARWPRS